MKKRTRRSLISVLLVLMLSLSMMTPIFAAGAEPEIADSEMAIEGYIFGPWFGTTYIVDDVQIQQQSLLVGGLTSAGAQFIPFAPAKAAAEKIGAAFVAYGLIVPAKFKLTITKSYREVKFDANTLAYYETWVYVDAYCYKTGTTEHSADLYESLSPFSLPVNIK